VEEGWVIISILGLYGVSFFAAPSTATLSHEQPASSGMYRDSCGAQDSDKTK
jgi:hypothetical protein